MKQLSWFWIVKRNATLVIVITYLIIISDFCWSLEYQEIFCLCKWMLHSFHLVWLSHSFESIIKNNMNECTMFLFQIIQSYYFWVYVQTSFIHYKIFFLTKLNYRHVSIVLLTKDSRNILLHQAIAVQFEISSHMPRNIKNEKH